MSQEPKAPRTIVIRNRQRVRKVNERRLRRVVLTLLRDLLRIETFELGLYLVGAEEMTWLNETFLRHAGTTDVITFDYGAPGPADGAFGEIFVCLDEAVRQARRFRTTWRRELTRYVVHGVLHLRGYNDHRANDRRAMKRVEDRLLRTLNAP